MSDALKFVLELVDKATGPAKNVTKALKGIESSLKGVDIGKATAKVGTGLASMGAKAGSAGLAFARDFAPYALTAIAAVEAALVGAGIAVGKFALEQMAEQETSHLAISTIIKDAKIADEAFSRISALADFWGTDPQLIEKDFLKLIQKGHDLDSSLKIIAASRDLKVLGKDASALVDAFSELDDKGVVTAKSIAAIAGAGLDRKKLVANLGIDDAGDDIQAALAAALKSGVLDAATLQSAALLTVTQMTGEGLGGLAKKQSDTLGGLIERLKTVPHRIFDALDTSGASDSLKKSLNSIIDALTGPAGMAAAQAMADAFAGMAAALADVATPGNLKSLIETITKVVSAVYAATAAFAGGFGEGFSVISDIVKDFVTQLGDGDGGMDSFMESLRDVAKVVGFVVGAIALGIGVIIYAVGGLVELVAGVPEFFSWAADGIVGSWSRMFEWFGTAWTDFTNWLGSWGDEFGTIGSDLVDGMWDGITAGWRDMLAGFDSLVEMLPDAVKSILGIASPSKVMMELGGHTAEGFNIGLKKGSAKTPSMFADVLGGGAAGLASPMGGSSAGGLTMGNITVQVNVPAGSMPDPEKNAQSIAVAVRREIIRFHEGLTP